MLPTIPIIFEINTLCGLLISTLNRDFFFKFPYNFQATMVIPQTMIEAEHNRPNPKFFDNRPSASATEVFGETIGLAIF